MSAKTLTFAEKGTITVACEVLGFYRDQAMSISMGLQQKRSEMVVAAAGELQRDEGLRAASMIAQLEALLEAK